MKLQSKLLMLGNYGCYLICLCKQFNQEDDILRLYDYFLSKGYIGEDCYVKDPVSIVKYLSGNNYTVSKVTTTPVLQKGDFYVERWYNKATGLAHFTLHDYDPLGESKTRLNGSIESYRYFKRKI